MPPDVLGGLVAMSGLTSLGILVLVGLKMRFDHRFRMQQGAGNDTADRLTEAVEQLHEEVRLLREEFADLQERVDFTERVLSQGEPRGAIAPRETTPV